MNITVTFTGTGDAATDGRTLSFEDVGNYSLSTPADVEETDCATGGCAGCGAVHRRFTGPARLILTAEGRRDALLWKDPEAAT